MSQSSIVRTVRVCRWDAKVNSLWLWWYGLLYLVAEAYLMYRAVSKCKEYNELPWKTEQKPVLELYLYIALIVISIMCVPFFVITCLFQVGNYANDGTRLGRDNIHEDELLEYAADLAAQQEEGRGQEAVPGAGITSHRGASGRRTGGAGGWQSVWRHLGPVCHGFHIMSTFALLLPSVLVEAQQIKYGFVNPDHIWGSELDILFGRNVYKSEPTIVVSYDPIANGSSEIPHMRSTVNSPEIEIQKYSQASPEFIGYFLALVIYSLRYGGVFWYTKMSFSFVFAAALIALSVQSVFSFCGMAILYKFQVNAHAVTSMSLLLPASATMILYLLTNTVLFFSTLSVFNYGYHFYNDTWEKFLKSVAPTYARVRKAPVGCQGYLPHTIATLALVCFVGFRAPVVFDYVMVYRKTGFTVLLGCIVCDALYMVTWISIWFGFTVKQTWDFKIMFGRYMTPFKESASENRDPSRPERHRRAPNREGTPEEAMSSASAPPAPPVESRVPNGQAVQVVDTDNMEEPDGKAINPTGVLRKSNREKRNGVAPRVKFESSAKNEDGNDPKNRKRKRKDVEDPRSNNNDIPANDPQFGSLRRANSETLHDRRRSPPFDDYQGDSTPENTLTRSYRHSIRDKCGQYFRPPAQSSPLSPEPDSMDELILSPLTAESYKTPLSGEGAARDGVKRRQPNGQRGANRYNDSRYSYPPASPHESSYATPQQHLSSNQPVRHSAHFEFPEEPRESMPSTNQSHPRSHPANQSANVSQNGGRMGRSPQPINRQDDSNKQLPPLPQPTGEGLQSPELPPRVPYQGKRDLNRDLRLVSGKPELTRRDSALPSSNDTSSNESGENVLCSQV